MKALVLFEEMPPTPAGTIIGLGVGFVYVVIEYGFHSPLANAVLIATASLGIVLLCFWALRRTLVLWVVASFVDGTYVYIVSEHLISVKGDMGYELYPHIVMLSLVQIAIMYIGGTVIRHRQAKG